MIRREHAFGIMALLAVALVTIPVSAVEPHTGGSGLPGQSCQTFFGDSGPFLPPGFNTPGFSFATTMYAGSGHTANGNNPKAVSQYDVACFQLFRKL